MRILCVDDHPVIVKCLKNGVKRIHPETTISASTTIRDALSYAQSCGRDLRLCMTKLYNPGGITLAEQIRKLNFSVNAIFATVCLEEEHAVEVMKLRPNGHLTKPINEPKFVAQLQQLSYPVAC